MPFSRRLAVLCLLPCAAAASVDGDLRVTASAGYDSNVRRDYDQTDGGIVGDGVASVLATAAGNITGDNYHAFAAYDLGGRFFPDYPTEDTLVQAANLEASRRVTSTVSLGVEGRAKDRRGGDRDYTDLLADAFVDFAPDPALSLRFRVGPHRFLYWDNFAYSFSAPEAGFAGRYRFDRRHSAFFSADVGLRAYNAAQTSNPDLPPPPNLGQRQDTAFDVSAGYAYKGPFTLSLAYDYFEQDSNSFGQSYGRHRVVGTAGFRLPWQFFLLAEGALQYAHYPDGIYLSADLLLAQDEQNTNALSLKLVRPLSKHFDAEAHYGIYYNHLPTNGLTYLRQVAWLGVTWRL